MTLSLHGYLTTSLLRASARTRVFEASRKRDGARVVAKVFDALEPGTEARVEHEFRVLAQLDSEGVVRPIGLERAGRQIILLLEHIDGQNLEQLAGGQPLPVDRFLPLAIELCSILARIHAKRIIHRDIKPSNILIEAGTGRPVFADFGISVLLEHERRYLYDPSILAGTLPYVSPEQTGRTQREVDQRSDLYSLGVTFYELLTGQRPFRGEAPLELVHAHLALRPRPPRELCPTIPRALSNIVLKLLEKAPEHRYQSARGLLADLDRLAAALAGGEAEPEFALAERDVPTSLQLPHQLYGRERERALLADELAAVVDRREPRLLLIGGAAGTGKTALIHALEGQLSGHGGYFGVGKFEQPAGSGADQRDVLPYRGVALALRAVLAQVLTESDERLADWRRRLHAALGPLTGVLVGLIPELALIVDELAPVPAVELGEARNRLHLALARMISTLAEVAPLLLVFDDLQWSDAGSHELLEALVGAGLVTGPVLFVGAYRSELVELDALLDEATRARARSLTLAPISDAALARLLADVLRRDAAELGPLAATIGRKTGNNPLFVRQVLGQLGELGLLRVGERGWEWDLDGIAAAAIPDDLLEIMAAKLDRLPARERALLERAACVGARVPGELLAKIAELSDDELAASLYALEADGLLVRVGADYQFSHDRIQAAARERLDGEARRAIHQAIGRELLAQADARPSDERLFEIVDQLDLGLPELRLLSADEREQLATLNLDAGQRALDSAAWRAALRYFELALRLLGDGRRDPVGFSAEFGRAQALALAGDPEAAERAFERLLRWPLALGERARVIARRVQILRMQDRQQDAIELGRLGLEACGIRIPARLGLARMLVELLRAWRIAAGVDLDRLLRLPDTDDERASAAMDIASAMKWSAFAVDTQLYVVLMALHVRLVMRRGYHPTAPDGLAQLAFAGLSLQKIPAAVALGATVVELTERRVSDPAAALSAAAMYRMYVGPTGRPFAEFVEPLDELRRRALELGDRIHAGYLAAVGQVLRFESGEHLGELLDYEARTRREDPEFGSSEAAAISAMIRGLVRSLAAEDERPPSFVTSETLAAQGISPTSRYAADGVAALGHLLLGEHERARALIDPIAKDYETILVGFWIVPRVATVDAIVCGEAIRAEPARRRPLVRRLRKSLAILRRFARACPDNYAAMAELAQAELTWARGRPRDAFAGFERARAAASEQRRVYVEALASLRLVALAQAEGWASLATGARRQAHATLTRWGAWAAVARLERADPELRREPDPSASRAELAGDPSTQVSSTSVSSLDLNTVLDAMQTIAEDLRLEQVIPRVLAGAIENAGADRGLLLLEQAGSFAVVAEGDGEASRARLDRPLALREAGDRLASAVVHYVLRTGESVVVDDARADPRFVNDDYIASAGVRSILCMPIIKHAERIGALVLENRLSSGAFTHQRLATLELLLGQAASALDNARLYAQLQRSEAQWRSLVDGVPDVIALVDARGRIEFVNQAGVLERAGGRARVDAVEELLDPSSAAAWRAALAEVVAHGETRELEVCATPSPGERRWFITRICPINLADRYLAIATDVTARKTLEAQVQQQQRLESVGTLASGVAHEINNPIQGIMNYVELISARPADVDAVLDFSGEIMRESQRVADIVRNLLAFARKDPDQQFERREVAALIDDTLSLVRAVLRKDQISLAVELPPALPPVRCRSQQVQQIIMNLVTNARDALNERWGEAAADKRIDIRAEPVERDGASWVRISVRDRGNGVPEQLRARIFDPFFTTKGRDQGTGLGLALSHKLAADHGGELSVESELGVGSCFCLDLPAAEP